MNQPRLRDRVMSSVKEREIQKTVVSHWAKHKEAYLVGAACTIGTFLLTRKSTVSQRTLFGDNYITIEGEK